MARWSSVSLFAASGLKPEEVHKTERLIWTAKHGCGSVVIFAAMSWYSAGPLVTLNCRITASDYVDTVGNQVLPAVQMSFPKNIAVFQRDYSPAHSQKCSVLVWAAWRCTSTSSQANTIARLKYHWTSVVSFREQVRSRFPPPSSLNVLEDVLHKERYSSPLETVQNLYESIAMRTQTCFTGKW